MSLPRILESFNHCYDLAQKKWFQQAYVTSDPTQLTNDSLNALFFFTTFAHERGGRNPRYSLYHRVAINRALGGRSFDQVLLNSPNFSSDVWNKFIQMAVKPNEKNTRGVVKDVLDKMRMQQEPNIVNLVSKASLIDSYMWLKKIRGIGPKIASLFLRDVDSIVKPWRNIPQQHFYCMQPIDRWVRFWSRYCWPNQQWPNEYQVEKWAKIVVNLCNQSNLNSQDFNKGSWFVGSHFDDMCQFFDVPEHNRIDYVNCVIQYFNANVLHSAINNFMKHYEDHEVFPV